LAQNIAGIHKCTWPWQNDDSFLDHCSLPLNTTLTPFTINGENAIYPDISWTDMFGPVKPYLNKT
jgi:hypothetical protein